MRLNNHSWGCRCRGPLSSAAEEVGGVGQSRSLRPLRGRQVRPVIMGNRLTGDWEQVIWKDTGDSLPLVGLWTGGSVKW